MASKSDLTIYVENRTNALIVECLEDGTQLDMMRDLWYEMKDDDIVVANRGDLTEEEHGDKIVPTIRKQFAIYAESDPSIYTRLGLDSRFLVKGSVPIVVIFEKKKKVALQIVNKFHAGHAFGVGQFPTFESVHVANYFSECGYNKGYVFVVSDYDPAGESMCNVIRRKMNRFSNIDIETIWVNYGDDPVSEFNSYALTDNGVNRKWIEEGRTRGVEFNTRTNTGKGILTYLTNSIVENVDPRYYVLHSYKKWFRNEQRELALADDVYQEWSEESNKLYDLMNQRRSEYREAVSRTKTDYFGHADHYVGSMREHGSIVAITEARGEETRMSFDDIEYFQDLLGDRSPYTDDYDEYTQYSAEEIEAMIATIGEEDE